MEATKDNKAKTIGEIIEEKIAENHRYISENAIPDAEMDYITKWIKEYHTFYYT